ncbi:MAG: ABC transporter ATP-binding protein/permease, partial [Synergistaceae bacterium]|nr:ABC transporter ATP-binding protein/permease [Synergistaceae bacterium]
MRKQFVLTGENTAYRAEKGPVELYAARLVDGNPRGRLYHFKTIEKGDRFIDYPPIKTSTATWACMVKCVGPAEFAPVPEDGRVSETNEFALFTGMLEKNAENDALLLQKRLAYSERVLSLAAHRLVDVNSHLSSQPLDKFDCENEDIKVCKVLCDYLKVEPRLPFKDTARNAGNPAKEILYLSGIRYKDVLLPENWWKHNNGAMLAHLKDGTPVTLMPRRISGYLVYDPKQNATFKVDEALASKLELKATAVFRTFPTKKMGLKDIVSFILGEHIYKEIAVILLCSFLANVIQVIPAIVSEQIFDVIVPENLQAMLLEVIMILIAFEIANIGFSIVVNLGVSRINTKIGLAMQTALWDRLLSLRIPFFDKFTTGELLQKIKGIDEAKNMISMKTMRIILANLFSFINIIMLFKFNSQVSPYVLLMFLGLFLVYFFAGMDKYKLFKRHTDLENKSMSFSHQCVRGIHRIKVSCAEERIFNIWSVYEADKRAVKSRIKMIDAALSSFQLFFDFASTAAVYFLIAQTRDVAMGMFIAYISTFLLFQKSMRTLLGALNILPEFISVCVNVKPILDAEPEYNALKAIPKDMRGTLEVNHAVFRYGDYGRTILNGISFRVEEGESVGVVGLSGGGKSTLLKLLMGFYDLTAGKIYYGGYDLETIDLRYLRKHMGVALQNSGLLVGDIYGNISENDTGVEHAAVVDAIATVGLTDMVDALPNGLRTRLEHCDLSDGEKQRLMIARAIAKKNKFLFLDEATSSLDNISQNM